MTFLNEKQLEIAKQHEQPFKEIIKESQQEKEKDIKLINLF
ncbi:hypothetical protein CoNPh11_CDS0207 [Staphylococcus phage S-CoN_Ph11]|nr:hypothetical protein CoNPh11_CDS0207 [Staphylococcus phage S-CoN_Ph11]